MGREGWEQCGVACWCQLFPAGSRDVSSSSTPCVFHPHPTPHACHVLLRRVGVCLPVPACPPAPSVPAHRFLSLPTWSDTLLTLTFFILKDDIHTEKYPNRKSSGQGILVNSTSSQKLLMPPASPCLPRGSVAPAQLHVPCLQRVGMGAGGSSCVPTRCAVVDGHSLCGALSHCLPEPHRSLPVLLSVGAGESPTGGCWGVSLGAF